MRRAEIWTVSGGASRLAGTGAGQELAVPQAIACVQNPLNLADRASVPVLDECHARGIAFVPFFPLGSAMTPDNQVLANPRLRTAAGRLGRTPAQVALAWMLSLRPNVVLIPGTSSVRHLEDNLAAADIDLDDDTRQQLDQAAP